MTEGAFIQQGRFRATRLGLLTGLILLVAPVAARAESDPDALLRRGVELRRAGKDDQALEKFRQAYKIRPTSRARAQVGLAEQALGQWIDAESDLLAAVGNATDAWIVKNKAALGQALALVQDHLGNLQILGAPAGASVKVDDRDVGTLPMAEPARVNAGEVLVSVSAPGHVEIRRKLTVSPHAMVRDAFNLLAVQQEAPGAIGGSKRPVAESESAGPPTETLMRTEATAPADRGRRITRMQGWAIATAAAGVAAAGVAGYFVSRAIARNNDSKPGCLGDACDPPSKQARLDALAAGNKATIASIVGGALVATGVVLFIAGRPSAEAGAASALMLTPAVAPDSVALIGTLRFQ